MWTPCYNWTPSFRGKSQVSRPDKLNSVEGIAFATSLREVADEELLAEQRSQGVIYRGQQTPAPEPHRKSWDPAPVHRTSVS